jgi:hypothetical protein
VRHRRTVSVGRETLVLAAVSVSGALTNRTSSSIFGNTFSATVTTLESGRMRERNLRVTVALWLERRIAMGGAFEKGSNTLLEETERGDEGEAISY